MKSQNPLGGEHSANRIMQLTEANTSKLIDVQYKNHLPRSEEPTILIMRIATPSFGNVEAIIPNTCKIRMYLSDSDSSGRVK